MTIIDKTDFLEKMKHVQQIVLENLMIHDEFANYFNFLNLQGYKRMHENEYLENVIKNRLINRYILTKKLLPANVNNFPSFNIIPHDWHTVDPLTISADYTLKAVKDAFSVYLERMEYSKEHVEKIAIYFSQKGDLITYSFLNDMVKHYDKDIKYLTRYMACLNKAESIDYIMEKQDSMHDEYRDDLPNLVKPLMEVKY